VVNKPPKKVKEKASAFEIDFFLSSYYFHPTFIRKQGEYAYKRCVILIFVSKISVYTKILAKSSINISSFSVGVSNFSLKNKSFSSLK